MKFRPQRGGLDESMQEMIEINSLQNLADKFKVPLEHVRIDPYDPNPDERIGWPMTCIVMVQPTHLRGWVPTGFTDALNF